MNEPSRHTLSLPRAERDPLRWLVLGSGPTRAGWEECAELTRANVFAVNGGVLTCPNPSAYLTTDRRAFVGFARLAAAILSPDVDKYIGQASVEAANSGSYQVCGMRVRTAAQWAVYLSLKVYRAAFVEVFGVSGYEPDGSWQTVSTTAGDISDRAALKRYRRELLMADPQAAPNAANMKFSRGTRGKEDSNANAAALLVAMAGAFPAATIRLRGDGPVQRLIRQQATPKNLELDIPHNMEVP